LQLLPELGDKFGILQIGNPLAGEHNNIQTGQFLLLQAKLFTHQAFDAIALDSEAHVFFGNNQPQAGMRQLVGTGEDQEQLVRSAEGSVIKDSLEISRAKQAQRFAEGLLHSRDTG